MSKTRFKRFHNIKNKWNRNINNKKLKKPIKTSIKNNSKITKPIEIINGRKSKINIIKWRGKWINIKWIKLKIICFIIKNIKIRNIIIKILKRYFK